MQVTVVIFNLTGNRMEMRMDMMNFPRRHISMISHILETVTNLNILTANEFHRIA